MVTPRIVFFSFLFRNAHTPRLTAWLWSPVIRKQRKTLWYKPTSIGVHQSYKTYFSLQRWQTLLIHFFTLWTRNAVERKKQNKTKNPRKMGMVIFSAPRVFPRHVMAAGVVWLHELSIFRHVWPPSATLRAQPTRNSRAAFLTDLHGWIPGHLPHCLLGLSNRRGQSHAAVTDRAWCLP